MYSLPLIPILINHFLVASQHSLHNKLNFTCLYLPWLSQALVLTLRISISLYLYICRIKVQFNLQKIAYCKTDSDLIAKQKGTYKERGSKRKEEEKKKKKGKDAKGATVVPSATTASG